MKKNNVYKNEILSHTDQPPHLVVLFLLFFVLIAGMTNVITKMHLWQLALHWMVMTPFFMMT